MEATRPRSVSLLIQRTKAGDEPAATGARPDELAMFDDSFRSCHAAIEQHIHKNPDDAFMPHMFRICAGDSDDQQ